MASLWKGPDHLVYVRGSGFLLPYTEEYKRYRFRDIQVISVAKKSRIGMAILYAVGVLSFAGPMALMLALVDGDSFGIGMAITVSILSLGLLLCLSLLIRHLILGPVCTCDIQTNLSRDRIRPLNRYLRAMEIVAEVEQEIRASQSSLAEGEASESEEEIRPATAHQLTRLVVPGPVIPVCITAVVFGLGTLAALHLESLALTAGLILLLVGLSFLLTFSLIASIRKATPEAIRSVLWVILGMLFLFLGTSIVYLLLAAAQNPAYTIGVEGPLEAFTGVAAEGGIAFYAVFGLLSLGLFCTGLVGVVQAGKWKSKLSFQEGSAEDPSQEATSKTETSDNDG